MRAPLFAAILTFVSSAAIQPMHSASAQQAEGLSNQIIVKWRTPISIGAKSADALLAVKDAEARVGVSARALRTLATGGEVLRLDRPLSKTELKEFLATLSSSAQVEYVEKDQLLHVQMTPNDPLYSDQWHYFESTAGISLPRGWDSATGAGVVVAVLDTGYRPHADLASRILPGYDFVPALNGRDGDGRDADARDPGDRGDGCENEDSTWHGTHVAGTIAAVTNNGVGVAGIAFGTRILPVRVVGTNHGLGGNCGALESDIADAMIWAAGGNVTGVPTNPNRAKVLNLSIGREGSCSATMQTAITSARGFGAVVVVAAGNDTASAANHNPANCSGVIAVTAVNRSGAKASYSNTGGVVDIAAPGGDGSSTANWVWSTSNTGTDGPAADAFRARKGTSMAAAHVSGVAALALQRKPSLTPDQLETLLRDTARPFPGVCVACGAGIVNAAAGNGTKPAAPGSITGSPRFNSGNYTVTWSAVSGATHYFFQRSLGPSWSSAVNKTGTSMTYSNQTAGDYRHRAKACNDGGCSAWKEGALVTVCQGACE